MYKFNEYDINQNSVSVLDEIYPILLHNYINPQKTGPINAVNSGSVSVHDIITMYDKLSNNNTKRPICDFKNKRSHCILPNSILFKDCRESISQILKEHINKTT